MPKGKGSGSRFRRFSRLALGRSPPGQPGRASLRWGVSGDLPSPGISRAYGAPRRCQRALSAYLDWTVRMSWPDDVLSDPGHAVPRAREMRPVGRVDSSKCPDGPSVSVGAAMHPPRNGRRARGERRENGEAATRSTIPVSYPLPTPYLVTLSSGGKQQLERGRERGSAEGLDPQGFPWVAHAL